MLEWVGPATDRLWYWFAIAAFVSLGLAESWWPARFAGRRIGMRWATNAGLQAFNSMLITVLAPAELAALAVRATHLGWAPLTSLTGVVGDWPVLVLGLLALDLYAFGMHWLQHRVFALWRLHSVHHADVEMDVSTTLRHHPLEVLLSSAGGAIVFALLGIPQWVFPVYALAGITGALIQHANVGKAGRLDRALRTVFVTPGMHQVHHSSEQRDFNANFGNLFSFWDRLFRTFRAEPALGRTAMAFGVEPFTDPAFAHPRWALLLPLALRRTTTSVKPGALETSKDVPDGSRREITVEV